MSAGLHARAPWARADSRATLVHDYGTGQSDYGGAYACTTIATLAAFYCLYIDDVQRLDARRVMLNGAAMWRGGPRTFENVREALRVPGLDEIVSIAEDGDVTGSARDADVAAADPGFLRRTVEGALDVLDAARRALAALTPAQRRSPRLPGQALNGSACAVFTTNGGSALLVAAAAAAGAYYWFDSHAPARLYRYATRHALAAAMRAACTPDHEFTLTIVTAPHARMLNLDAPSPPPPPHAV